MVLDGRCVHLLLVLYPERNGLVFGARLHEQRHVEVLGHDELALDALHNLAFLVDGSAFAHEEGVTVLERFGLLAHPALHTHPNALIILSGIEVVVLGLDVAVVECSVVGFARVLDVGRGNQMATVVARAGVHRICVAEAHGCGQVGVFLEISHATCAALDGLVGHGATRPAVGLLLVVPLARVAHVLRTRCVMDENDAVFACQLGKLQVGNLFGGHRCGDIAVGVDHLILSLTWVRRSVISATCDKRQHDDSRRKKGKEFVHCYKVNR